MSVMQPCPFAPKKLRGAHDLCLVIPENDGTPVLALCSRCGDSLRYGVELPSPMDDLPSSAIADLARQQRS
jgi:hypothetical protein